MQDNVTESIYEQMNKWGRRRVCGQEESGDIETSK